MKRFVWPRVSHATCGGIRQLGGPGSIHAPALGLPVWPPKSCAAIAAGLEKARKKPCAEESALPAGRRTCGWKQHVAYSGCGDAGTLLSALGSCRLGDTPLHEAAGLGQVPLLVRKAPLRQQAEVRCQIAILPILMAAYANPLVQNAEFRSQCRPLALASHVFQEPRASSIDKGSAQQRMSLVCAAGWRHGQLSKTEQAWRALVQGQESAGSPR